MTFFMPSHRMPQTIKLQGRASRKTGKQKLNTLLFPTREVIKDSTGASKNCKVTVDQAHWTLDSWGLSYLERSEILAMLWFYKEFFLQSCVPFLKTRQ